MKKQSNLPARGRKLSLNKKTISNLKATEMNRHIGGANTNGHNNTCKHNSCQITNCYTCVRCPGF